jgi:uncharacterized protein (TIGR04255 family)
MVASPPVQDVLFALHFVSGPLTVVDVASWVKAFNDHDLSIQQQPALPTMPWAPGGQPQPTFFFGSGASLPRIFLRREDTSEYFIFQEDRVAFGWHRVEPIGSEAAYPGYDNLRLRWHDLLGRFVAWYAGERGVPCVPRLIELGYQNAFLIEDVDGRREVPAFFRLADMAHRPLREFQLSWRELVAESGDGYVDAVGTIGTVPPARTAFLLNFMGLAQVAETASVDQALDVADRLHSHIRDMYAAAIAEESV